MKWIIKVFQSKHIFSPLALHKFCEKKRSRREGRDDSASEGRDDSASEGRDDSASEGRDDSASEGRDDSASEGRDEAFLSALALRKTCPRSGWSIS